MSMANDRPVALALLTQAQLDMLGDSLKIVFDVNDGGQQFADLLRALDDPDSAETILAKLTRRDDNPIT